MAPSQWFYPWKRSWLPSGQPARRQRRCPGRSKPRFDYIAPTRRKGRRDKTRQGDPFTSLLCFPCQPFLSPSQLSNRDQSPRGGQEKASPMLHMQPVTGRKENGKSFYPSGLRKPRLFGLTSYSDGAEAETTWGLAAVPKQKSGACLKLRHTAGRTRSSKREVLWLGQTDQRTDRGSHQRAQHTCSECYPAGPWGDQPSSRRVCLSVLYLFLLGAISSGHTQRWT